MRQVNSIIHLDLKRLDRPLVKLHARQFHSFVALVEGVPEDCSSAFVRVFRTDDTTYFDLPLLVAPDGSCVYAPGLAFPDAGNVRYEVHALDAEGNQTALGSGEVGIGPFSATGEPLQLGEERPVMQILDRDGGTHTITAVWDGESWTSIVDDDWAAGKAGKVAETVTDRQSGKHPITEQDGSSVIGD